MWQAHHSDQFSRGRQDPTAAARPPCKTSSGAAAELASGTAAEPTATAVANTTADASLPHPHYQHLLQPSH
ncbi:unnamed protein product [Closterium sp. NIES-54]